MASNSAQKIWQNFEIDHKKYMICTVKQSNNKWTVFLSDLLEIWTESLSKENILEKCQTQNPLLSVDALEYEEIVINMLNNISDHVTEATVDEIKLRTVIEGIIFKFSLNLSKGSPQDFWENITKPLCLASMELLHRQDVLLDLIQKKDEEIAEYKAEGAELIRKNIETKPFNEDMFQRESKMNFSDCTNAFQQMVQFCNRTHIKTIKIELDSEYTSPTNVQEIATGQTAVATAQIKEENDNTDQSNGQKTNGNVSLESRMECGIFETQENDNLPSTSTRTRSMKNKVNERRHVKSKIKDTPIVIPSSKKRFKKTLNDFIL